MKLDVVAAFSWAGVFFVLVDDDFLLRCSIFFMTMAASDELGEQSILPWNILT